MLFAVQLIQQPAVSPSDAYCQAALLQLLNAACNNDTNLEQVCTDFRVLPACLDILESSHTDAATEAVNFLCTASTNDAARQHTTQLMCKAGGKGLKAAWLLLGTEPANSTIQQVSWLCM